MKRSIIFKGVLKMDNNEKMEFAASIAKALRMLSSDKKEVVESGRDLLNYVYVRDGKIYT